MTEWMHLPPCHGSASLVPALSLTWVCVIPVAAGTTEPGTCPLVSLMGKLACFVHRTENMPPRPESCWNPSPGLPWEPSSRPRELLSKPWPWLLLFSAEKSSQCMPSPSSTMQMLRDSGEANVVVNRRLLSPAVPGESFVEGSPIYVPSALFQMSPPEIQQTFSEHLCCAVLSHSVVSNSLQPRGQRSLVGYSPSPVLAWILQARILERVAMPSSRERAKHHAHIDAANRLSFSINSMYGWVLPAQIFLMAPRYCCFWDLSFIWIPPTDPHQIWKRDSHCLGRGFYVKQWFPPKGEFTSQKTFSNGQKLSGCHKGGEDAPGIWWVKPKVAATYLSMYRATLTTENYPAQNGNSTEAEKPWGRESFKKLKKKKKQAQGIFSKLFTNTW